MPAAFLLAVIVVALLSSRTSEAEPTGGNSDKVATSQRVATSRALAKKFADPTVQAAIRQGMPVIQAEASEDEMGSTATTTGIARDIPLVPTIGIVTQRMARSTPADMPPLVPREAPLRNYTAGEVGRFPWRSYERDGYSFAFADEGEAIYVLVRRDEVRSESCGPHIGSSLDARMNPTWSTFGHLIWLWGEGDRTGCVAVSKYEHWMNKDMPRPLAGGATAGEHVSPGDFLTYFRDVPDRSYTMPPDPRGGVRTGYEIHASGASPFRGTCDIRRLPAAAWTAERGFVGISIEDTATVMGLEIEVFNLTEISEARRGGWFYVFLGDYPPAGDAACWRIGNGEIPEEPCLHCQVHLLTGQIK